MSGNPAQELATLLAGWDVSGRSVVVTRGGSGNGSIAFWRGQARAVECLGEIDRLLAILDEQGRRVSNFKDEMPAWYRAVFSYSIPWNTSSSSGSALDPSSLSLMEALAVVIDMMGESAVLSSSQRAALAEALDDARALLSEELAGVSDGERAYITTLVEALRHALSADGPLDGDALKRTIDQLNGALMGVAAQLSAMDDVERSQRVLRVIGRITSATRTVMYDAAALSAVVAAVPIVQKMIGQ